MLLALDTSTHTASVALYDERGIAGETTWRTRENHTRSMMPELVHLMDLCGTKQTDLEAIGIATGPGSFTGLRIGLSAAKGLAYSLNLPLIGVPTLDVTASGFADQPLAVIAIMQAGRARYGGAYYENRDGRAQRIDEYFFASADALAAHYSEQVKNQPVIVTGELDEPLRKAFSNLVGANVVLVNRGMELRRAGWLAALAWQQWRAGQSANLQSLAPYYIPTASLA
jgi:tRNA threonylcarbamoyladenosine biosynthesis protein TsaB